MAVTVSALTQDASNTTGKSRGVKHLVLAGVRHGLIHWRWGELGEKRVLRVKGLPIRLG